MGKSFFISIAPKLATLGRIVGKVAMEIQRKIMRLIVVEILAATHLATLMS